VNDLWPNHRMYQDVSLAHSCNVSDRSNLVPLKLWPLCPLQILLIIVGLSLLFCMDCGALLEFYTIIVLLLLSFTEAEEVRSCLRRLEERLGDGDGVEGIRKNFNELICLLDSPLFCQLLSIEDSLDALRETLHDRSLDEDDFDIDPTTGKLVVLESGSKLHQTDSDRPSYNEAFITSSGHFRSAEDKNANMLPVNQHVAEVYPNLSDEGFPLDLLEKLAPGSTIESITLDKPDVVGIGMGFGIVGLRSDSAELGVYIKNIQPGGVADR